MITAYRLKVSCTKWWNKFEGSFWLLQ